MKVTRKGFISSVGAALGASVIAPPGSAVAGVFAPKAIGSASTFSSHLGTPFQLATRDGKRVSVVLSEVMRRKSNPRTDQFSLVFAAHPEAVLPSGTYQAKHAELGSFLLFVTPGQDQAGRVNLRADFNLLQA